MTSVENAEKTIQRRQVMFISLWKDF